MEFASVVVIEDNGNVSNYVSSIAQYGRNGLYNVWGNDEGIILLSNRDLDAMIPDNGEVVNEFFKLIKQMSKGENKTLNYPNYKFDLNVSVLDILY